MKRRNALKAMLLGAASAKTLLGNSTPNQNHFFPASGSPADSDSFESNWQYLPDMPWIGEKLWPQRLQDFAIRSGELHCLVHGVNRTVNLLTQQLAKPSSDNFSATVSFRFLNQPGNFATEKGYAGFRLGINGRYPNYRSAIFTGKGINAGLGRNGKLFIDREEADTIIPETLLTQPITLDLDIRPDASGKTAATLTAKDNRGKILATVTNHSITAEQWAGNLALVSHFDLPKENTAGTAVAFLNWKIKSKDLLTNTKQVFGPIYFAQYTLHEGTVKLTAQLAPIDHPDAKVHLQILKNKKWQTVDTSSIHPLARTAGFRITNWDSNNSYPYRVLYTQQLTNGKTTQYSYEGTIAAEPKNKASIKALAFSCNWELGFPDEEVVINASMHKADLAFFLGDQFYESNGGFGIEMGPLEKSTLDYLRKWYMFGWSYRDLFRHIPMIALPDDHDVYHGNVWGSGGRAAIHKGSAADMQDSGGYKMPAQWVNMAQITQTSHMPDPFDKTPVDQGIQVYYTEWKYGGLDLAIIEDRKFKSAPKDILPEEARIWNGYAKNPAYNQALEKKQLASLIGDRQKYFLEKWLEKPKPDHVFRVVLSATPFCCLQTLPAGSTSDDITSELTISKKGEYVSGDMPTKDMDSNGWPHYRRDEIVSLMGKKVDLHLVGDQHIASVVQYGTSDFDDGCFCFAVPALNNIWPRRWWPTLAPDHQPLPGKPVYTGRFLDGFGNKMTVHAAASPFQTGKTPALLYDRVTGYGVLDFNTQTKKITLQCWPRFANPLKDQADQYEGWPIEIDC